MRDQAVEREAPVGEQCQDGGEIGVQLPPPRRQARAAGAVGAIGDRKLAAITRVVSGGAMVLAIKMGLSGANRIGAADSATDSIDVSGSARSERAFASRGEGVGVRFRMGSCWAII